MHATDLGVPEHDGDSTTFRRTLRAIRRHWRSTIAVLAVWTVVSMATMLASNPFSVTVREAARLADWDPASVSFQRGSYGFRLLYSRAEADVVMTATDGTTSTAHIELTHLPLVGWSVEKWDRR